MGELDKEGRKIVKKFNEYIHRNEGPLSRPSNIAKCQQSGLFIFYFWKSCPTNTIKE